MLAFACLRHYTVMPFENAGSEREFLNECTIRLQRVHGTGKGGMDETGKGGVGWMVEILGNELVFEWHAESGSERLTV